jgi:hypothetical protein
LKRFVIAVFAALACVLGMGAMAASAGAATVHQKQGITARNHVVQVHREATVRPMSVSPVQLFDQDGNAGWYTQSFDTDYYRANATLSLNTDNTSSLIVPFAGAGGDQLCNSGSGNTAQEGEIETAPGSHIYEVGFLLGTLNAADGIGDDPCDGNSFLGFKPGSVSGGGFVALATLPVGDQVQIATQQSDTNTGGCESDSLDPSSHSHTAIQFNAADIHDGVEIANYQSPWYCLPSNIDFNEVGDGQSTNLSVLGGPVADDLIDFSGVTGCQLAGFQCGGLARWTATSVSSSGNGEPPALLEPTMLTPSVYARTCVKNKKGKTVCTTTGGGPSTFSIMGAVPVGL